MDLELATVHQIVDELANRGSQFIIAIQIRNNYDPLKIHLCVDGQKNKIEVAKALIGFFDKGEHG